MVDKKEHYDITLDEWVKYHKKEDELRDVFLNMDRALQYIHNHGYCIEQFHPTQIYVLNDEIDHIQFKKLIELPSDPSMRREWINEDIFNSAFIQISIYSNSLQYLKPEFLKENFDSFIVFLPTKDVPYYRGIIQRGASVYFAEFDLEQRKRDLVELEKQFGEDGSKDNELDREKVFINAGRVNDKINDVIYKQINGLKDAAFINYLLIPTMVLSILCILALVVWIFGLFS